MIILDKIEKWTVVWLNKQPIIVYRSYGAFKIYKLKIETVLELLHPIKGENNNNLYQKIRKILCEDLDGSACDDIRPLYSELERQSVDKL